MKEVYTSIYININTHILNEDTCRQLVLYRLDITSVRHTHTQTLLHYLRLGICRNMYICTYIEKEIQGNMYEIHFLNSKRKLKLTRAACS